ncbi:adhesion G-protein coupled receptor G2-like [Acipenser oxyrinchus oxyrinchus]|uniref:Adhesion G-protein coupled receptor G2-like n=1 Tax=Acipenser oxyrinchus oxyrinchus TaxID=40147 RepID=A0AAD8D3N2_ACIOX|nr:adhesion G-protein coupled receptor G2-like [Acipenser oxyrinchus oxyrinchus]
MLKAKWISLGISDVLCCILGILVIQCTSDNVCSTNNNKHLVIMDDTDSNNSGIYCQNPWANITNQQNCTEFCKTGDNGLEENYYFVTKSDQKLELNEVYIERNPNHIGVYFNTTFKTVQILSECAKIMKCWPSFTVSRSFSGCINETIYLPGNCSAICVDLDTICKTSTACKDPMNKQNFNSTHILNVTLTNKQQQQSLSCNKCKAPTTEDKIHNDMKNFLEPFNGTEKTVETKELKALVKKIQISDIKETSFVLSADGVEENSKDKATVLQISKEALQMAVRGKNETIFVVAVVKDRLLFQDKLNSSISNEIIAIDMGVPISNLKEPISMTFYHSGSQDKPVHECVFWDSYGNESIWNNSGCETHTTQSETTCKCYHLTFFAVLSSPYNTTISASTLKSLTYISYIGCGISFFFLAVVLFMHIMLRRAKSDTSTTILINLCAALSLLNLTFLMNEWLSSMGNQVICNIIAATMHYSLLCTFTWFGIKAFYLYYLIIKLSTTEIKKIWMKMGAVGWGMPAVIVIILGGLKKYGEYKIYKEEGGTVSMCWITDPVVHYITNIGYYALVFSFTVVIFIVVSVKVFHMRKSNPISVEGTRKNAFTLLGLASVLGITWGVMFFNVGPLQVPSFYVFTILNSLQGFFIFLWYYNSSSAAKAIDQPSEKSSHSGISNTTNCNPYDSTARKS